MLLWLAWLALMATAAAIVARATIVTDITAFLPGPATPEQRLLAEQLRDGVAARLILVGVQAAAAQDAPAAAAQARRLAQQLRADPHFAFVANGEAAAFERERQLLLAARYVLSPQVDAETLSVDGLRRAFARLEAQLSSALAPALRPFATQDPTGELLAVLNRIAPRAPPATKHGVWFGADGRTALLLVQTRAAGFDVDAQAAAVAALRRAFEATTAPRADKRGSNAAAARTDERGSNATAPGADKRASNAAATGADERGPNAAAPARLLLAGTGVFSVESRNRIEQDAERLSLLALVLIAGLLLLVLRSPRFVLLAGLPAATGALAGLAVIAAGFGEIHGITLGFGLTLLGETVDYAIYVHMQRAGAHGAGQPAGPVDARVARALWLAVLTSAAGFLAMILSGFRGLAQLGVFSLVGVLVAGAVARWLLPNLLPARVTLPPVPLAWPPAPGWARVLRVVVVAAAISAAALLAQRGATVWDDGLAAISPLSAAAGELDATLRQDAGLPELRWLVAVERASREEALQAAEALRPALEELQKAGVFAGFDSPADLMPSERTQKARRDALPAAETLRARLAQALQGSNFEPAAFDPFVESVATARAAPPLTPAHFQDSALGQRLAAQLVERADGRTTILVTLHRVEPAAAAQLAPALAPRGAAVIDLKGDIEQVVSEYRRFAVWAAAGGALLIVAVLAIALRDVRVVGRIVVALLAAVVVTAAALVLATGALTLFHLVALLLVVGVGSNYAMFFARLPRDRAARHATAASVLLAAGTTFTAFALLATSTTPVLHMIGLTVSIGAVVALLAAAAWAAIDDSNDTSSA